MAAPKPGDFREVHPTKCVGSVTTYMRKQAQAVHTGEVNVPCNGCTACCRSRHMPVELFAEEAQRLDHTINDDGTVVLKRNEDGSCAYLIDNRCSIYKNRPTTCKHYDCRLPALLGISPIGDEIMSDAITSWYFTMPMREDRVRFAAIRMAVQTSPHPCMDEQIAASTRWPKFREAAGRLLDKNNV